MAEKDILIRFLVSKEHKELIQEKMKLAGTTNMSGYLRKMSLDGYIIKVDLSCVNEMTRLLSNATNNINQITKRVNETGNVYQEDISEVKAKVNDIWDMVNQLLLKFIDIIDM